MDELARVLGDRRGGRTATRACSKSHGHGGRPNGLSLEGEATEQEEEEEDVPEDGALTLDAWVPAAVMEKVEGGRELARCPAAGEGEDADGDDDPGRPAAIPCTGT